jgi:ATP-dependent Clp protease protease subunit
MLIHQPSGGFQGQQTDIAIHAGDVRAARSLGEIRRARGQSMAQVHEDMERRFFTRKRPCSTG